MKKLMFAAAVALWSMPAFAVDLSVVLKDDNDQPAQDQLAPLTDAKCGDKTGFKCLTLGAAAFHALVFNFPDENTIDGEAKFKRGLLAAKIKGKDNLDLSAEDIATIKRVIGKLYGAWIVTQSWQLLDPGAK